eukprot:TRINITY_DN3489_c0_g1_i1.p1 TRINITY_DN3489_c0_g1~~TRINITY_DN3489_c0_g1_i1.p1  ORF type:complete len:886 (-),score=213.43 TRINITY_DN3489_c0_g1_i1:923-3580(-)
MENKVNRKTSRSSSRRFTSGSPHRKNFKELIKNSIMPVEEDQEHEFKAVHYVAHPFEAITEYCLKYINAFLNTNGGTIYFGVEDDGKIVGLNASRGQRDELRLRIDSIVSNIRPQVDVHLYQLDFYNIIDPEKPDEETEDYVIAVKVERGRAPVYKNPKGVAWMRMTGSTRKMDPLLIEERIKQGRPETNVFNLTSVPRNFTGRKAEIGKIRNFVNSYYENNQVIVILLHGLPLVGKTSLARRLIYEFSSQYTGRHFLINMKGDINRSYITPKEAMTHVILQTHPTITPPPAEHLVPLYLSCFDTPTILLIENAGPTINEIEQLIPRTPKENVLVLITSQKDHAIESDIDFAADFGAGSDSPREDPVHIASKPPPQPTSPRNEPNDNRGRKTSGEGKGKGSGSEGGGEPLRGRKNSHSERRHRSRRNSLEGTPGGSPNSPGLPLPGATLSSEGPSVIKGGKAVLSFRVGGLSLDDGVKLLCGVLGRSIAWEDGARIVQLCGNMPLPIRVAASTMRRMRNINEKSMIRRLEDEDKRRELVEKSLDRAFDYADDKELKEKLLPLTLFPGPFEAIAAATIYDKDYEDTEDILGELLEYSLLEFDPKSGFYSMLDLVKLYFAKETKKTPEMRQLWIERYLLHFTSVLTRICQLLDGDEKSVQLALDTLICEGPVIRSCYEYIKELHVSDIGQDFLNIVNDCTKKHPQTIPLLANHPSNKSDKKGISITTPEKKCGCQTVDLAKELEVEVSPKAHVVVSRQESSKERPSHSPRSGYLPQQAHVVSRQESSKQEHPIQQTHVVTKQESTKQEHSISKPHIEPQPTPSPPIQEPTQDSKQASKPHIEAEHHQVVEHTNPTVPPIHPPKEHSESLPAIQSPKKPVTPLEISLL